MSDDERCCPSSREKTDSQHAFFDNTHKAERIPSRDPFSFRSQFSVIAHREERVTE